MTDPPGIMSGLTAVLLACLILVPGVLMIIRRRDALGLCLALLGAGVVTSLAGLAAVIAHTTTRPWFFISILLTYLAGVLSLMRLGWLPRPHGVNYGPALMGAATVGLTTGAIFLLRAPVQWDARSIWFFHASWFAHPSTVYVEYASNSAVLFSHPDYPPLAPSFGAFAWLFGDPSNDWVAQTATGVLTLAAIGVLAILVARKMVTVEGQLIVGSVTAVLALGVIQGNSLDGYVDGLAAVLIATLAVMAFRSIDPPAIALVALATALVKNEALLFLAIVVLPLYLLRRRSIGPLLPGILAGLAWIGAVRAADVLSTPWRLENVLPWSSDFALRLQDIISALLSDPSFRRVSVLWLGSVVIAWAARAPRNFWRPLLGMGAVAGGLFSVLVAAYLASPDALALHLDRSADRLLMHPSLVLCVGALLGLVGLLSSRVIDPVVTRGDGGNL